MWTGLLLASAVWLAGAFLVSGSAPAEEAGRGTLEELRHRLGDERYSEVEEKARSLLAAVEAGPGPESVEAAEVLDVLVEALRRGGKARDPEALAVAERAVRIKEISLGPADPGVAESLTNLGALLWQLGRYDDARAPLERGLEIREKALGPDHPDVAKSLHRLGALCWSLARYPEARSLYERALAIREKAYGPNHLELAESLSGLGSLFRDTGDLGEAERFHEHALRIREQSLGPEHPDVARSLNNLGLVRWQRGDFAGARPLFERGVRTFEGRLGPTHPLTGQTMSNLANLLMQDEDFAGAKLLYERSLEIWRKALGEEHPTVAQIISNLGILHKQMGDYEKAQEYYERALQILEKALDPSHPTLADSLHALGDLLSSMGDCSAARPRLERALEIREKVLGPTHPRVAETLNDLGNLYRCERQFEKARPFFERALAILEAKLSPTHPFVALGLENMADLSRDTGDAEGAERFLRRALAVREGVAGPEHPSLARSLTGLAALAWERGDRGNTLDLATRAAAILDRHVRDTLSVLPERQALALVAGLQHPEQTLFTGLLAAGESSDKWLTACWEWTVRRRGLVHEELAARHRAVLESESAGARRASNRLAQARRGLASLVVRGPDERKPERYRADLDRARQEKEAAEAELARISRGFERARSLDSAGLREIGRSLQRDAVLVEVVRTGVRTAGSPAGAQRYIALVLRPGGAAGFVDLGRAERLDELVRRWREALRAELGRSAAPEVLPASALPAEEDGHRLREAAWDPIVRKIAGAGTVFLVPEGTYHQIALAALPAANGGFLVETGPAVHLVSAARDVVRFAPGAVTKERRGRGVLALGSPDFDADESVRLARAGVADGAEMFRGARAGCKWLTDRQWPPLPESEVEVRRIAKLVGEREPLALLTGAAASEERFKRESPGKRVLHLATHGFFLPEDCASARGHDGRDVAAGSRSAAGRMPERVAPGENPLLLSGLVLAGANRARQASPSGDDGVLTAEELASLDLRGVDMAVLSACDTGLGDVAIGEGVFGLRRALEIAGVRTVVMSLWPVPDRQARRWMATFYEEGLRGAPVYEASRRAALVLLRSLRAEGRVPHPYLWTGFVAAGDWR